MCRKCLKEPLPDRQTTCLDAGSYLLNWNGCGECGSRDLPSTRARLCEATGGTENSGAAAPVAPLGASVGASLDASQPSQLNGDREGAMKDTEDEEDEEEVTTYEHACSACGHAVCEHYYRCTLNESAASQEYFMECLLCGKGADTKFTNPASAQAESAAAAGATASRARQSEILTNLEAGREALVSGLAQRVSSMALPSGVDASTASDVAEDEWGSP